MLGEILIGGSAELAVQAMAYQRLNTDRVLIERLKVKGVFDAEVQGAENEGKGVVMPYILVGESQENYVDLLTRTGNEVVLQIDTYSTYAGFKECKQITGRVKDLFHRQERNLVVAGFRVIMCVVDFSTHFGEGNIRRGIVRLRITLQPTEAVS